MIKKRTAGTVMVAAVLAMIALSILVPLLVRKAQRESKDTQTESLRSVALHLAEAGQDRGAWKLRESSQIWEDLLAGTTISGYFDDTEYVDVEGGTYKIHIYESGGNAVVISKGKAENSERVRAIQATYSKGAAIINALNVQGGINYKPNLQVHWGPVVTYQSIDQSPSDFFPRKYSAGQITGRDTTNDANNGAMPGDDWVTYDYASFYDLGTAPDIDLDAYRDKAENTILPFELEKKTGNSPAAHDTSNGYDSGLYTEDVKMEEAGSGTNPVDFECSTCVIFIDGGDVTKFPSGSWLDIEALVVTGNVDFNADSTAYTATIPPNASEEYQHSSLGTYFTDQGWVDGGTENLTSLGMHGFLYVGGNLSNSGGGTTLCGAIYVVGDVTLNTMTLYYDKAVAVAVETGGTGTLSRLSWDEIVTSW